VRPTIGLLVFALLAALSALSALFYRRRSAARRLEMGTVSPHWLSQMDREHDR
jgi:hypothetical protein